MTRPHAVWKRAILSGTTGVRLRNLQLGQSYLLCSRGDDPLRYQPPCQDTPGAESRDGCNTCHALSSSSSRCLGVSQFSVLRGRSPRWSAMASRSASVRSDRSVPLGMYWHRSPFVFSLVPRCQGECGSQKYTSRPSCEPILRCWASSLPWSQVSDNRKESGNPASLVDDGILNVSSCMPIG